MMLTSNPTAASSRIDQLAATAALWAPAGLPSAPAAMMSGGTGGGAAGQTDNRPHGTGGGAGGGGSSGGGGSGGGRRAGGGQGEGAEGDDAGGDDTGIGTVTDEKTGPGGEPTLTSTVGEVLENHAAPGDAERGAGGGGATPGGGG